MSIPMKKILFVILALVYMSTTTGAGMHLHYYMGELDEWSFGKKASGVCGNCGMDKSSDSDSGCCKDEQTFVKNSTDQKMVDAGLLLWHPLAYIPGRAAYERLLVDIPVVMEYRPVDHAPPLYGGLAACIFYHRFLI